MLRGADTEWQLLMNDNHCQIKCPEGLTVKCVLVVMITYNEYRTSAVHGLASSPEPTRADPK